MCFKVIAIVIATLVLISLNLAQTPEGDVEDYTPEEEDQEPGE